MDAKTVARTLFAGIFFLFVLGCTTWNPKPAADSQTSEPPEQKELTVVRDEPEAPPSLTDPFQKRVLEYIDQIGVIAGRAQVDGSESPAEVDSAVVVADVQPGEHPSARSVAVEGPTAPPEVLESFEVEAASIQIVQGPTSPAESSNAKDAAVPTLESVPQPPVLKEVKVTSVPSATSTTTETPAEPPTVNAPVVASNAPISLSEFLDQWPADTAETSFVSQLDRRLLQLISGRYDSAGEPMTLVSSEQQALASGIVDALIALREGHLGDPTGAAKRALQKLETLADTLRELSDLTIPTLVLCREVRGYGQYVPLPSDSFPGGRTIEFVAYCELRNFASERGNDGIHLSRFDLRTTVMTASGDVVLEIKDNDVIDRCRNLRRDCFIPRLVRLPATLSPGEYVVKMSVADKIGRKVAEQRATFRVAAR